MMEKEIGWLLQEKYHNKPTAQFKKDVERIKAGEPLDFVIGFTEFLGCKIDVSKKTLIPRFETEHWAEEVIDQIQKEFNGKEVLVLDMFSGSGCVGVAIAKHVKNAHVTFADIDESCIEQITINTVLNKLDKASYAIVQSDIFSNIEGGFNYITANPPYIPLTQKETLQKSVIDYESEVALFGGENGLLYIERFLTEAKKFLLPKGKIFMEFDTFQKDTIEKLLQELSYASWEFKKDQYDAWRWVEVIL